MTAYRNTADRTCRSTHAFAGSTFAPTLFACLVAAGLLMFDVFSLVEARYRRINDPHVPSRLKRAAAG